MRLPINLSSFLWIRVQIIHNRNAVAHIKEEAFSFFEKLTNFDQDIGVHFNPFINRFEVNINDTFAEFRPKF